MKVTQADVISLLTKYSDERIPVLAAFVTPSLSTARITGVIHLSMIGDIPQMLIG